MSIVILSSLLLCWSQFTHIIDSVACDGSGQCFMWTLTENGINDITCGGFYSCGNASITITGSGKIECYGSYSCYSSYNMTSTNEEFGGLECYGLYSCAKISQINITTGDVLAYGEKSLYSSNVTLNNGNLFCDGDRSCANSFIYGSQIHYLNGYLAGQNSIFNSLYSNVSYYFFGGRSGDGATIVCQSGHTCTINCYGNGCNNLTARCNPEDTTGTPNCNIVVDNCSYAENAGVCEGDGGYSLSTLMYSYHGIDYEFVDIEKDEDVNITFSNYENSFTDCNALCGGYESCAYYELALPSALVSDHICCSGQESCLGAELTAVAEDTEEDEEYAVIFEDGLNVRCDGYGSCANVFAELLTKSKLNFYFAGGFSAEQNEWYLEDGEQEDSAEASNSGLQNIIITGAMNDTSFYEMETSADYLLCHGDKSCSGGSYINNVKNIFANGMSSLASSIIGDNVTNVYCGAFEACNNSVFDAINGDIYGAGYRALYNAIISNVRNGIFGFGYQALSYAHISNAEYLFCDGSYTCSNTIIINVTNIVVNGSDVLSGSTIISGGGGDDLRVTFYDGATNTAADNITIYCNSGDVCKYEGCSDGDDATDSSSDDDICSRITFYCDGICVRIPTAAPTWVPSDSPTESPTASPSSSPTLAPTGTPQVRGIYIFYNDVIENPRRLSLARYATELANETQQAFAAVMSDTNLSTVCNDTNDVNSCNYNPWPSNGTTHALTVAARSRRRRRNMLESEYSYKIPTDGDFSEGWWQGRVENLQFCVVLQNLMWNPNECGDYDELFYTDSELIDSGDVDYIAYGTFEIVADENVEKFDDYFMSKFNNDSVDIFLAALETEMNGKDRDAGAGFRPFQVIIDEAHETYVKTEEDKFGQAALDVTYGLYGFIAFCVLMAIGAKIHTFYSKADDVKELRIVLFGVWTWDCISDLIFGTRAIQQKYYIQGALSLVFFFVPWMLNMKILVRAEKRWIRDNAIKYRVSRWLFKFGKKLVLLTALCGSPYASCELCNCRAFGMFFVFLFLSVSLLFVGIVCKGSLNFCCVHVVVK